MAHQPPCLGFVMDPIDQITPRKDSTLAMMLAAQARGWRVFEIPPRSLALSGGRVEATFVELRVFDDDGHWYESIGEGEGELTALSAVLMRCDPPFDIDYLYATYLLEQAEASGVAVVNRPRALRDANEKLFTAWFPDCCPETLVTAQQQRLRRFIEEQGDAIVKPLDAMGGTGVFRLRKDDPNIGTALETLTECYRRPVMAQTYLSAIRSGDKRVLLVDGEAVPYALARLPKSGETRANLATGGSYRAQPLTAGDRRIADRVAPTLVEYGLRFVGLDIIGEYLTEINVTSPTCIREIARGAGVDAAQLLMDALAADFALTDPQRA